MTVKMGSQYAARAELQKTIYSPGVCFPKLVLHSLTKVTRTTSESGQSLELEVASAATLDMSSRLVATT